MATKSEIQSAAADLREIQATLVMYSGNNGATLPPNVVTDAMAKIERAAELLDRCAKRAKTA